MALAAVGGPCGGGGGADAGVGASAGAAPTTASTVRYELGVRAWAGAVRGGHVSRRTGTRAGGHTRYEPGVLWAQMRRSASARSMTPWLNGHSCAAHRCQRMTQRFN